MTEVGFMHDVTKATSRHEWRCDPEIHCKKVASYHRSAVDNVHVMCMAYACFGSTSEPMKWQEKWEEEIVGGGDETVGFVVMRKGKQEIRRYSD